LRRPCPGSRGSSWELRLEALEGLLGRSAERARLACTPVPQEAGAASYCPLCSAEYRAGFSTCADCGVPVLPFSEA
jgi:hypothetical protein